MAAGDIFIKQELRPCLVKGKKAVFHKWIEKTDVCNNKYSAGLVEFEDGTLDEVYYGKIKFIDNKINEYAFEEKMLGKKRNV